MATVRIPPGATDAQICAAIQRVSRVAPVTMPAPPALRLERRGLAMLLDVRAGRATAMLTPKGSGRAVEAAQGPSLRLLPKHRHERRPWSPEVDRDDFRKIDRCDDAKVIVNRNGTVMAVLEADWTWVRSGSQRPGSRGGSDRKVWRLQSRGRLPRLLAAEINGKTYNEIRRILRRLETK